MAYAITACTNGSTIEETRVRYASAVVLAQKWLDAGLGEVRIVADGRAYSLDAFRRRLVATRSGWKDCSGPARGAGAQIRTSSREAVAGSRGGDAAER